MRKTGVAFDREEHTLGICAAGVVMRDPLGNDLAISVPVPAQRFHEHQKLIAERLLATRRAAGGASRMPRRRDAAVPAFAARRRVERVQAYVRSINAREELPWQRKSAA